MLLGGNLSSGQTSIIIDKSIQCSVAKAQQIAHTDKCCSQSLQKQPSARYPSMVLSTKACPPPTPAEFAKYPKIAVASSVRTESLANGSKCPPLNPVARFAKYERYQVPVPCPLLPASANMAGISLPSSRACNL
jgi:hypothetical protein